MAERTKQAGRPQAVSRRTSREHEMMVRAVQALEGALASPAPRRERAWKQRIRRELATVVGSLQEHCESAESPEGILTEVELRIGRASEVSQARREHDKLLRDAMSLLSALDEFQRDQELSYPEVRRRALQLTARLRSHQAREADLLMFAFQQDIGVGD